MIQGMRVEKDSLGEIEVPVTAYYGAQTQRAVTVDVARNRSQCEWGAPGKKEADPSGGRENKERGSLKETGFTEPAWPGRPASWSPAACGAGPPRSFPGPEARP